MGMIQALVLMWLATLVGGNFINFQYGFEYEYNLNSQADVKSLGDFHVSAKVGFTNVADRNDGQEVYVRIYALNFKTSHTTAPIQNNWDFSKWFSFVIAGNGEIVHVYHPPDDDEEAVAMKKAVAALFASRLHPHTEKHVTRTDDGWAYDVTENGHEGRHRASYTVHENREGHVFTKSRHPDDHPVKYSTSQYTKTLYYSRTLGTIHSVHINESFRALHKVPDGYDPLENTRPITPVNDFTKIDYPEMSALGSGKLEFLTRHKATTLPTKPTKNIRRASIRIKQLKRKKPHVDVTKYLDYVWGNLTCMRAESDTAVSKRQSDCFWKLVSVLKDLPDEQVTKLAKRHLQPKIGLARTLKDRNHILDALSVMNSDYSQQLVFDYVLNVTKPNLFLVQRFMIHIASMKEPPIDCIISWMEHLCFEKEIPTDIGQRQTTHRVLLILGSVARKLWIDGRRDRAVGIISRVEKWLGIHDPWHYIQRRAVMNENETKNEDHWKVVLVETLGNAGLDQSLEHIVSHVNATNSNWVKRAGLHALRKYHHEDAAHLMLRTALYDEDEKVRYEALLQYQSHPKAAMVAPMYKQNGVLNGSVFYDDPYKFGMHNVNLQNRQKRNILNQILDAAIQFHIVAPGVNWKKLLGSIQIGASLGLTMNNGLDFKLSLLESYAKLYVHDEVFARIHLGFMNKNIEFFLARICFKYSASYNLNLIKEYVRTMQKLVRLFDNIKHNAAEGIGAAVRMFRDIIAGEFNFVKMIQNFIQSLQELPEKMAAVGTKALQAMKVIGGIDDTQLPHFIKPVQNLVQKVLALYKETKSSVFSFFNNLMETVTIVIPRAGETLYKCIKAIIESFKILTSDPKQAISNIAGNVLTIKFEVKNLINAMKKTRTALGEKLKPPHWTNLGSQIVEITDLARVVRSTLEKEGDRWVKGLVHDEEDPVAKFTKGKLTMIDHRKEVVKLAKQVVDDVLSPLDALSNLGGKFFEMFQLVYTTVQKIKDAYNDLKEGYSLARSLIDQIFGPKTHKDFTNILRDRTGDCSGSGTFPSSLGDGHTEYTNKGIDLSIIAGETVVAPFTGNIRRSDKADEVIIVPTSGSLKETEIILNNVRADSFVQYVSDDTYVAVQVAAGQRIGVATDSPCSDNHIHFALKRGNGFVDPTMYLSPRLPTKPKFIKECSDYKIVFLDEVISEGWGVGEDNDKEEDTSPQRTGKDVIEPPELDPAADPDSRFQKPSGEPSPIQDAYREKGPKMRVQLGNIKDNALKTLFKNAEAFMKKFSIRDIKLGAVMDLLEVLGLDDTQEKLANAIKTIKEMIDNKPCFSPYQMTDEELKVELSERGLKAEGSREQMINVLNTPSNSCPLTKIAMPKHIYCTFDDKCLGVECCAYFKLFMFRKTYKVFARFDPCTFEFSVGAGKFNHTFGAADGIRDIIGGFDKRIRTGIKLNLLGDVELVLNVKLEKDDRAALISLGAGFCSRDNIDDCVDFFYILEDAPTPLPICNADGTVTWPEIDFKALLSKESIRKRIEGKLQSLVNNGLEQLMSVLPCIPSNAPGKTKPCSKPDTLTTSMLKQSLNARGLTTTGSRSDMVNRLKDAHSKCTILGRTVRLPTLPESISKLVYMEIGANCLRVDLCIDVKLPGVSYYKPVKAFMELDPCKFIFTLNFESCTEVFVLLGYDWGKDDVLQLGGVDIKYKIDRDEVEKSFKIDLGLNIGLGEATPFLDSWFIRKLNVPIPVCDDKYTLPGGGSFKDLADMMGGKLNQDAVNIVFRFMGLATVFVDGACPLPTAPQNCPSSLPEFKKHLPSSFQDKVNCQLSDNCFGIQCCVDFTFNIPIFEEPVVRSVPLYLKFKPCEDFMIDAGFGTFSHQEKLLTYDWGQVNNIGIGKGDPAPIVITYSVSKEHQSFLLDLSISTCLHIDGNSFCFPPGGLKLLDQESIPACDAWALVNFTRKGFSMSNWLGNLNLDKDLNALSQAAALMLLDKFGISQHLLDNRCDVTRTPYSPSVDGWHDECTRSKLNLPKLPKGLHCHLAFTCLKVDCCFEVPYLNMSFHASINVDMCNYSIMVSIEKMARTISILGSDMKLDRGVVNTVDIAGVYALTFGLKVRDKMIHMDLDVVVCFEESHCLTKLPVMKGTQIPQVICDLDTSWDLQDFKLSEWIKARGLNLSQSLTRTAVNLLLDQLGIRDMMLQPPCSRASLKYQPADDGNWKNDCHVGNRSITLPAISLPANCHINDRCLGIDCCLTSEVLGLSLRSAINIDLCNYVIMVSLEKFSFKFNILEYNWGTYYDVIFDDVSILKLRHRLDRLLSQEVFVMDLSVSLCLEGKDCELDLEVLHQTYLPMPRCDRIQGFKLPDFSLTEWLKDKGGVMTSQLSFVLLKELGLSEVLLDIQCEDYQNPYSGAESGWTNACPEDLKLPMLPSGLTCHLMESCTGLSCCMEVKRIKRNFNAFISVDTCNYHMNMGIEKLSYSQTLINYQWGKTEEIDFGGLFRIEFQLDDMPGVEKLLVNLKLKVCLTAGRECEITVPVLKDMLLPKLVCDWDATKQLQDFSLQDFVTAQGAQLTDVLSRGLVEKLLEVVGVSGYLLDNQCTKEPRVSNGWTSACPVRLPLLALPDSLSCSVPDHCTGVICCMNVPLISRNVQFQLDVDMCEMSLTLVIEKLEFKKMIFNYQWGKRDDFTLKGIFRADFVIDNLDGEKELLVSLNISACFDAEGSCVVSHPVLKEARFPHSDCNWNSTLSLRGFSLSGWFRKQNLDPSIKLSQVLRLQLAEALRISQYIQDPMCDRSVGKYKGNKNGWNSACPKNLTLPKLPDSLSCHVPDYCTGVDCCISVDSLGWSFHFKILLDLPNFVMTIGIEKLVFQISLFDYTWGQWDFFNLNGVVRLSFKIDDLKLAWKYLLNLKLSLCFEADRPCVMEFSVLSDITFPKMVWKWKNTFSPGKRQSDFSLKKWFKLLKLTPVKQLEGTILSKLLDHLGLTEFLKDPQCNPADVPYVGAVDGWKKDCPTSLTLPTLPATVTCHLSDPCGTVECCLYVEVINKSINIKVGINPCTFMFTIGIEKLVFTRALTAYDWGDVEHFSLKGLIHVDFMIDNLFGEKKFLISLNASVCFEPDSCLLLVNVLKNIKLPKPTCDWERTVALKDFSVEDFQINTGTTGSLRLPTSVASKLFERLEIAGYLSSPQCDRDSVSYIPAVIGWKNDCPISGLQEYLPALPNIMACHVTNLCTSINCCVFIDFLTRSFNFRLSVDMCTYQLIIGVENLEHTEMLFDYQWGTNQHFFVKGVLRINYEITRLSWERKLELTASISVCLNETNCIFTYQILDKAKIPHPPCDWSARLANQDFHLPTWMSGRGLSSADTSLTDTQISQLLDDLGVAQYLLTFSCNQTSTPYTPANVKNWNNDCTKLSMTRLPDSIKCHLSSNCSHVDCCLNIPLVKRNIHMTFNVDVCGLVMTFTIEKLTFRLSLLEYQWGTRGYFILGSMTRLVYKLDHIPVTQKLMIDLGIKICLEERSCVEDISILSGAHLNYSLCPTGAHVPFQGVSLDFWNPSSCSLPSTECSPSLPATVSEICQLSSKCTGVTCCLNLNLGYLGIYSVSAGIIADHCNDQLDYHVENKHWTKSLNGIAFGTNHTESVGKAITLSYVITKSPSLYKISLHLKLCVMAGHDMTINCYYSMLLDHMTFLRSTDCSTGSRRKKRSVLDLLATGDPQIILREALRQDMPNSQIKDMLERLKEQDHERMLKNIDIPAEPGPVTNTKSIFKEMGRHNPGTIVYSGDTGGGNVVAGIEGVDKIMKILGVVTDIIGRQDQPYTVGKGLTGRGLQLLGAKLANMSIGEMIAMFDAKNIDPERAYKLTMELKDLAYYLYSDIVEAIIGEGGDAFKSFELTIKGDFSLPRQNLEFFRFNKEFLVGGFIFVTFEFGAGCHYGMNIEVGAKILGLKAYGQITPYAGVHVWGEVGVGFLLYAKLRLDGYIMTVAFPTRAEIGFARFPLDLRFTMDMEIIPLELSLKALVTLEIPLIFTTIKWTLFKAVLWRYTTPSIKMRFIDTGTKEPDDSPPKFVSYVDDKGHSGGAPATHSCQVRQIADRDYTEPALEIAVSAKDDLSQVEIFVDAGTKPGLSDVLAKVRLGGPSNVMTQKLSKHALPVYFTVFGENSAGERSSVTCHIDTYDVTLPGGRLNSDFLSTSNPSELRASVVVYEDSEIIKSAIGVGLGRDSYGDEVIAFNGINLNNRDNGQYDPYTDHSGHIALSHFSGFKEGRLMGPVFSEFKGIKYAGACVKECLKYPETKCLSVNYDYGDNGHCELLDAIEGHDHAIAISGQYVHVERLGVGLAHEFIYEDLTLKHEAMYYFNLHLINSLQYERFLNSRGVLVDLTPPEPGPVANVTLDILEVADCLTVVPDDRPDWEVRCEGVNSAIKNHRIVHDGPGSMTIFNGDEPLTDLLYTRANKYITANWDGILDKQTGILGYSWTVGRNVCEELIHPHHDPHKHLADESEWTHVGLLSSIPPPYSPLPDGKYYMTLRAINKVAYGGPLVTTICHTTPLTVDNSPPFLYEIFNITYDEETAVIHAQYDASDPDSDLKDVDLCLGHTTRDCNHLEWIRLPHGDHHVTYVYAIPGGTPVWLKLQVVNNVRLVTVGVADDPIIIDITPPVAGTVYDGPIYKHDLDFTKDDDTICANWQNFYDPESGISHYDVVANDEDGINVSLPVSVDHKTHELCVSLSSDHLLEHNKSYSLRVTAYNAGHKQLNVSADSNGVIVDLTPPTKGEAVDGRQDNFEDVVYSTHVATVASQWKGNDDPESDVKDYELQVLRAKDMSSDFQVLKDWITLSRDTSQIEWHNFHLYHKDIVKTKVKAINNALGTVEQMTDGFVVDLTLPKLKFIGDGLDANNDIDFQQSNDTVEANFLFIDEESGINQFKFKVFELYQGSKQQIYPDSGDWEDLNDASSTSLSQAGLDLKKGAKYSVRVGAVNKAGAIAIYDTNGVILDSTAPCMEWVKVGVLSGEDEQIIDGHVIQADPSGIKATWFAVDGESGIKSYAIAIGSTSGGIDILQWTDVGIDTDKYIDGLVLNFTNSTNNTPLYYVSIKATNGAGIESRSKTSKPIQVVNEDKAGVVMDGADSTELPEYIGLGNDLDYQKQAGIVTVQFDGFESELHGVTYFDWAVGTTPGGEEVQPFIMVGLLHREFEDNVPGNGIASSGFGQAVLPLVSGTKYYTTVRGFTNDGQILESTSDGFTVDQTPPSLEFESFAKEDNKSRISPQLLVFQSEVDSMSSSWRAEDKDSGVNRLSFSIGTYPHGDDVQETTEVEPLVTGEGALPTGITSATDGKPNILMVTAENDAGLMSTITSPVLVVDVTPPTEGIVKCPSFIQPLSVTECYWEGFFDGESNIEEFEFAIGSEQGLGDIVNSIKLTRTINKYLLQDFGQNMTHGQTYYAKVTATNTVGMTTTSVSNAMYVDKTPPTPGTVVELKSAYIVNVTDAVQTEKLNTYKCNSEEDCLAIDAVCQESLSAVNIAWAGFADAETGIIKYEVAVGTSPGGGQLKGFLAVDNVTQQHLTVTGLILKGERRIFVTVKATNGAGLSTTSTSNGIYMSYLSQGLEPLSHVGVWDGDRKDGDQDFQTSLSEIHAQWDVTGDPCPVVRYEWSIQRADGQMMQGYVDMKDKTSGLNDQLKMKNKERYYQYVRVTNAIDYTYTIRSNGITIENEPLVPGRVNDGDVVGFDLQFLRTRSKVSANWDDFGDDGNAIEDAGSVRAEDALTDDETKSSNQDVAYYEVALGTDRRFPKTRNNVVPFTKVGLNKTVSFYDLELTPVTAIYYFTVRARSRSGSKTEVTSNGFFVGFDGGVSAGDIDLNAYVNNATVIGVSWNGFESQIGMMMYYVGLSNNTLAGEYTCGQFTERGMMTEDEIRSIFNIADIRNVGVDTFIKYEDLELDQKGVYYVWVIGADKAGKCNMTSFRFEVDITSPARGNIRSGPYFNMTSSYAANKRSVEVNWIDFSDADSGLRCFHISLLRKNSCDDTKDARVIVDSIEIDSKYSSYRFMDLELERNTPYFARIEAENHAGLKTAMVSPPILYDDSKPSPGLVIDGHQFTKDISWIRTKNTVTGTFLHHPVPDTPACPVRAVELDDIDWKSLESDQNCLSSNKSLTLTYRAANIQSESSKVDIRLTRDTKVEAMFSGAYFRNADLLNGGEYKISIKAANGNDSVVTSVMFWDGPEDYILDYDYTPEPKWMDNKCDCCVMEPIAETCRCDCQAYLEMKRFENKISKRSAGSKNDTNFKNMDYVITNLTDKEKKELQETGSVKGKTDVGNPKLTPRRSCGLQIYSGGSTNGRIVVWCQFGTILREPMETVRVLEEDPSASYHNYSIRFFTQRDEARDSRTIWCMTVRIDEELVSEECGTPHLSTNTSLYFSVWNHKNYIPDTQVDDDGYIKVWTTTASFKDLVMPPKKDKLCRYGNPFQGGSNPIIRYEAAVGLTPGSNDAGPFREVYSPCVPCLKPCDKYTCEPSCDRTMTQQINITLTDLNLNETETVIYNTTVPILGITSIDPDLNETTVIDNTTVPILYYLTVKAVLGSGAFAFASSDGFYIDSTPPVFETDIMLYFDVNQGEYAPASFQGSNNTIKSSFQGSNNTIKTVWKCTDIESEVVGYEWAIGLSPGSDDIQIFVSTGEVSTGTNSDLGGVLENNVTYYVTVKCTNGGGLTTVYADEEGVTVLLEAPDTVDFATSIEGADSMGDTVVPSNAMKTEDQHYVGCSWNVSHDPSVKRYDFCVGSSSDIIDDICPCVWVGYNRSGTVEVKDGYLQVDGHKIYTLNQFRPGYNDSLDTNSSAFTMAPGTEMFIFMKMCNEAKLCTTKLLGSTIVETASSEMATSSNGSVVSVALHDSSRNKRSVPGIQIQTSDGLQNGQSIIVTKLTETDLQTEYKSDASTVFVPYITNPGTTTNDDAFLDRILRQRVMYQSTDVSFSLTSVGGLAMPGPLTITFPYDPTDTDTTVMLLHWNPDEQKWQQSNRSCSLESETEIRNPNTSTVSVKVCNTRLNNASGSSRGLRPVSDRYFRQQTQFLVTGVKSSIPDDPPALISTSSVVMEEDQGTLIYQMQASDNNGDIIKFKMRQSIQDAFDLSLSEDGLLVFTPPLDFHGTLDVQVILYEVGLVEIPPAETAVNITIDVTSVNDAPAAFAFSQRQNVLHADPAQPVLVLIEENQMNKTNESVYTWIFGAYDVDAESTMMIYFTAPNNGMLTGDDIITGTPNCSSQSDSMIPCDSMTLPHARGDMHWVYRTFQYQPDTDFHGYEEIRMYVKDQAGAYSDVITFHIAVLENPCLNGGACKEKPGLLQTCQDPLRTDDFSANYICDCLPGWTGKYCDLHIDECSSDPCPLPYTCYNEFNRYYCACSESNPDCDGLQGWMTGLIVLVCVLFIIISVLGCVLLLIKRGRLNWVSMWNRLLDCKSEKDRRRLATFEFQGSDAQENDNDNDGEIEFSDLCGPESDSGTSSVPSSQMFTGLVPKITLGNQDGTLTLSDAT